MGRTLLALDLGTCWPFTGVSQPSGPETPRKSEKSLPGPPAPRGPQSLEKVSKKSFRGLFETFSRLSRLFRDFFQTLGGPSQAKGPPTPGDCFQTFSGFRARGARETPVNGQWVPNPKTSARVSARTTAGCAVRKFSLCRAKLKTKTR